MPPQADIGTASLEGWCDPTTNTVATIRCRNLNNKNKKESICSPVCFEVFELTFAFNLNVLGFSHN